jgi:acyl-[acyl-carrier-protein] desaturase
VITPEESRRLERLRLLQSLGDVVQINLSLLNNVDQAWQPCDLLPSLEGEDWAEQLRSFREPAGGLSDDVLVVLVGDMVTEEALPSYAVSLNEIAVDHEGDSPEPWARWLRGWTAEENRHGDLLNAYLRLTGRVDMRAVEVTVHHLIANGFNPEAHPDPYKGLVYTSFQERATRISHANVGALAAKQGDESLARICRRIAGDESRHEAFYTRMMGAVLDHDPEGGMISFSEMMRRLITMPGKYMTDGKDPDLFDHFAVVAQRLGVYTVHDYASIIEHLVKQWNIAARPVSGKAAKAQHHLCSLAERYARLGDEMSQRLKLQPPTPFSWIHGREA